jgi:deaminated glutathione amidase
MRPPFRVALAQCNASADYESLIGQAKAAGADVVVFPEMLSIGYVSYEKGNAAAKAAWVQRAQAIDGAFVSLFRDHARRHAIHVVTTLLETGIPHPYNTAVLIAPDGGIVLRHRKVHICDFDTPEESCARGAATDVVSIATRAGPVTVGMMICMDREYADVAGALSARGAEVILVPNCCDLALDPLVGDLRIAQARGRAFETVAGMAVTNYPRPKADGHSFAVGPLGEILAIAGEEPALVFADFDLDHIRKIRGEDHFRWRDPFKAAAE